MSELSLFEKFYSAHNRIFFALRRRTHFRRPGYIERAPENDSLQKYLDGLGDTSCNLRSRIENDFDVTNWKNRLSFLTYEKTLATLWMFEQFPELKLNDQFQILETGCEDFARLPAIFKYFQGAHSITGIEIDPFATLSTFYSKSDRANYYLSLTSKNFRFVAADFFKWPEKCDLLLCFYPFLSAAPALVAGLGSECGDAKHWLQSICKALYPNGFALVIHQGQAEQDLFDEALSRHTNDLVLLKRQVISCPFYPVPYLPFASLYRKNS